MNTTNFIMFSHISNFSYEADLLCFSIKLLYIIHELNLKYVTLSQTFLEKNRNRKLDKHKGTSSFCLTTNYLWNIPNEFYVFTKTRLL